MERVKLRDKGEGERWGEQRGLWKGIFCDAGCEIWWLKRGE